MARMPHRDSIHTGGYAEGKGEMQYVELGRTGLRVSRLCLGTMNLGVDRKSVV